jgi:hypothetical protein
MYDSNGMRLNEVRPSCPKNSITKVKLALRLSNSKQQQLDSSCMEEILCENAILRFLNSFLQIKVKCIGEILREEESLSNNRILQ